MNLLSYNKQMKASSSLGVHQAKMATDEDIRTWWSAASGKRGEWLQMDLSKPMELSALQISFSDEGFKTYRHDKNVPIYQYIVEGSLNGTDWQLLADRSQNTKDQIYELIVLDKKIKNQFVRIKNTKDFATGYFSIADIRLFGNAKGKVPKQVSNFIVERNKDRRRIAFTWDKQPSAEGYVIRWGASPEHIDNAIMMYDNQAELGFFDRDITYYMTIEAFNESGKSKSSTPIKIN